MGRHKRPPSVKIRMAFCLISKHTLLYRGIKPVRLKSLILLTTGIASFTLPAQYPLTKTFVKTDNISGVQFSSICNSTFSFNQFTIKSRDTCLVTYVKIESCLCNPIFPPSGVSIGSSNPHCDPFKMRGPTNFAPESICRLVLRK